MWSRIPAVLFAVALLCVGTNALFSNSRTASPDVALLETLEETHDFAFAKARSGDEAHDVFCKCKFSEANGNAGLKELCPGISAQCKKSFCNPLCLRMAWKPKISVNCDAAKTWSWCPKFAAQVEVAKKAIGAHFQAFTCLDLHFCSPEDGVNDWVENHSFGNQYPKHHLPISACVHDQANDEQNNMLCQACERVLDIEVERGECLPQYKTLHPGSIQERCLYLADVISNRQEELVSHFKSKVCSCLGCCGSGKCLFKNPEENWLEDLIDDVQNKVTAQIELEGLAHFTKDHKKAPKASNKPAL